MIAVIGRRIVRCWSRHFSSLIPVLVTGMRESGIALLEILEQLPDRIVSRIGDVQRLQAELLLRLLRLELAGLLFHVGIDEPADAGGDVIVQFASEIVLQVDAFLQRAESRADRRQLRQRCIDDADHFR